MAKLSIQQMKRALRETHEESAVVFGCGLSLLALLWGTPWVVLGCAGMMTAALIFPIVARGVHFAWTGFGKIAGWINGFLILGVLFFLVLTPLALLRRAFRRSHFHHMEGETFFHGEMRKYKPEDLENPW